MAKVYLPSEFLNKPCYQINNDYIRVWDSINTNNNTYHDIFFKSDYLIREGSSNYSSYQTCDTMNSFTDNIIYRYDFSNILIALFIMLILFLYFPGKVIFSFFRRFRI